MEQAPATAKLQRGDIDENWQEESLFLDENSHQIEIDQPKLLELAPEPNAPGPAKRSKRGFTD